MNWKDIKKLIRKELNEATVDAGGSKFNLRTGVNKNPTKLGIKIQFEPKGGMLDTDVPRPEVIGFFIPLAQIKNLIVKSLTGSAPAPEVQAPEPEGETSPEGGEDEEINEMINEALINEMRLRDLNEISKVVIKEDFYTFINAGNNILRTMEERGMSNGKKYLGYLVKHNIM